MMLELNSMLAELAADGAHDSTGAFTVSLHAAEEKLGAYRLVNPVLFVLNLVAAAVTRPCAGSPLTRPKATRTTSCGACSPTS
jgi:hypothetical protein